MKKLILLFSLVWIYAGLSAQIEDPIKWSYEANQVGPDEHEVTFKATLEPGWHLYSQFVEEGGPIPTSFNFDKSSGFEKVGKTEEKSEIHKDYDPNFEMDLLFFSDEAIFVQKLKRLNDPAPVKGFLEYMVCNDVKCLPPTMVDFEMVLRNSKEGQGAAETEKADDNTSLAEAETKPQSEPVESTQAEETSPAPAAEDQEGIFTPVKWTFSHTKLDDKTYELQFKATIDEGWKIYSQHIAEGGPIPTGFIFNKGTYVRDGEVQELSKAIKKQDKVFEMELVYFKKEAVFTQKIVMAEGVENVIGELTFMTCDDVRCLAPEYLEFFFDLDGSGVKPAGFDPLAQLGEEEGGNIQNPYILNAVDLDNPVADCGEEIITEDAGKSLWTIFILGFVGGLVALLTPCVFPMIPLTVSFFTKSGGNKKSGGILNAFTYGFFIFAIYLILSLPFHFMESIDPEIFNTVSTNVVLNVLFFVIFMVFAFSFFGYYELTLPASFTNKVSSASAIGGFIGIFFMALTLAIVSFSCTGPILGSLLAGSLSSDGGAMQLTVGMGGFGLALALPFGLFAAFPGWLNSLPRSGGWMNTVKVVLGFAELALAVKFLSNADLVEHWGLLKREIFIGSWIVIGIGLTLYLFGKIHFPHDDKTAKPSWGRLAVGLVTLLFVVYLFPGLTNTKYANLQLLSGFPPPLFYSIYDKDTNCPLDLQCFKDYDEGLAYARKHNKPIMVDFTGWACVNCRKMEENVWVKPSIFNRLNDEYVLISLYVDDRKKLPEDMQQEITLPNGQKKKIRTVGNKWATLQTLTFLNNSQPYYVLLSPDEELLNHPVGYTPDEDTYKDFLDCGLNAFKKMSDVENNPADNGLAKN